MPFGGAGVGVDGGGGVCAITHTGMQAAIVINKRIFFMVDNYSVNIQAGLFETG